MRRTNHTAIHGMIMQSAKIMPTVVQRYGCYDMHPVHGRYPFIFSASTDKKLLLPYKTILSLEEGTYQNLLDWLAKPPPSEVDVAIFRAQDPTGI
ncbi:MAG: hypothetical protein ABR903_04755, partial [Thermodesulfovibrionales bacterium]